MPGKLNLEGQRFGRLTVISYAGGQKWNVRCDCGTEKQMRTGALKAARSCGCIRAEKSRNRAKNSKQCPVCGKTFFCSPSSKTVTCSPACKKIRRSQILRGHNVGNETREKIRYAAEERGRPKSFDSMIEGNNNSPKCQRGEMHSAAKIWIIENLKTHEIIRIVNLRNWVRDNINNFERKSENIDEDADRISHVFYCMKRNYLNGSPYIRAYGWQIIGFDDRTNWERAYKTE